MKRIVVYDLGNGKEEIFDLELHVNPEAEQHERASIANEEKSKQGPAFVSYEFKWVYDDYPTGLQYKRG